MEIEFVGAERFAQVFAEKCPHVYNSVEFSELNRPKCEDVRYTLFVDGKPRLGIVLGKRDGRYLSPFSAPFGGFLSCGSQKIGCYLEASELLKECVSQEGVSAEIALPPSFYDEDAVAKSIAALARVGELMWVDANYHYPLDRCDCPEAHMKRNARKNYHAAMGHGFEVERLDGGSRADVERAYAVIKANRDSHGYPLRMSLEDVWATAPLVGAEFFVMTGCGTDVAAAQVHRVAPGIGQVVYWGDAPGYGSLRPMNYFAAEVARRCREDGMRILDVGPSSEKGVPSLGLCDFKESIGCVVSPKFRFRL